MKNAVAVLCLGVVALAGGSPSAPVQRLSRYASASQGAGTPVGDQIGRLPA